MTGAYGQPIFSNWRELERRAIAAELAETRETILSIMRLNPYSYGRLQSYRNAEAREQRLVAELGGRP